jgi:hypothetical protein
MGEDWIKELGTDKNKFEWNKLNINNEKIRNTLTFLNEFKRIYRDSLHKSYGFCKT